MEGLIYACEIPFNRYLLSILCVILKLTVIINSVGTKGPEKKYLFYERDTSKWIME